MSSTNKTTNYDLSQFVGTDKPAWLTDYNQDMTKIDTGIHAAQSAATGADGKADANTANIGDMSYLSTTAKNTLVAAINEIDNASESAYNLASNASQTAQSATASVATLAKKFDLTNYNTYTVTKTGSGTFRPDFDKLNVASNSDGSLCKVYGTVQINNPSNITSVKITGTALRPTSEFTVACAGVVRMLKEGVGGNPQSEDYLRPADLTFKTNGDIEISLPTASTPYYSNGSFFWEFFPCLIFVKSFGDTPTPED